MRAILLAFGPVSDLTADDLAFFAARIWQILTSCGERRLAEYERTSWWEFIGAGERSPAYQKFLASGITRSLVAAKAREASTRTIGDVFVQLVLTIVNPVAGSADRVLDGPTNLVWIDPWRTYLESRGVHYLTDAAVKGIRCVEGRITGVDVVHRGKPTLVQGDHYVAALPLERITPMINASMLAADPSLANLRQLVPAVEWMNGVQFYLTRAIPAVHGHAIHIDTEWALTSISQLRFWRDVPREVFGDSDVQTIMSVDVSDWEAPGPDGRPAMEYSRDEAVREVWRQLKQSVNVEEELLRDEDLHSWFLDPDIQSDPARPGVLSNAEPLLVNWVDTWRLRPEAATGIANLFLASDYVRTNTDLATMEGANEAARRAVNALLDAVEFAGARCAVWPLHEPDILAPWHKGRAVVFESSEDMHKRIDDPKLDVDESSVLVLKNCGPKGYPGFPEVGNFALPAKMLKKGITDMIRISDARMSGTAYGTVVLHTSPEAAAGGPLALVRNGDLIELDVPARKLHLHVSDEELARRRAAWKPPKPHADRGWLKLYCDTVLQADEGVDLDFLVGKSGAKVGKPSH